MLRKPIAIFYFLLLYALAELVWWGYLLVDSEPNRIYMILGEGGVFLILLVVGAAYFHKLLRKERAIHQQQRNFLLSVTHELKSPLAAIKLYLQTILKRDLEKEKRDQFILSSIDDIGRLDDLVENMLLASKIENNSYTFPKTELNLSELIYALCVKWEKQIQYKRSFVMNIDENIYYVGDRFSLTSLVNNLIENAVKYSEEQTKITVSLKEQNKDILFKICDEGCGIDQNDQSKIFDKFFRSGNEMIRKTKGTGLGLFIVKQVALNHSADIYLSKNEPKGTCIEIKF
jgi:two-component system, OmpR family, phosphate regulon sensor histidine kinase PhoR